MTGDPLKRPDGTYECTYTEGDYACRNTAFEDRVEGEPTRCEFHTAEALEQRAEAIERTTERQKKRDAARERARDAGTIYNAACNAVDKHSEKGNALLRSIAYGNSSRDVAMEWAYEMDRLEEARRDAHQEALASYRALKEVSK